MTYLEKMFGFGVIRSDKRKWNKAVWPLNAHAYYFIR